MQTSDWVCIWNDVAFLAELHAGVTIGKTMMQISEESIAQIKYITGKVYPSPRTNSESTDVYGILQVTVDYWDENQQQKTKEIKISLENIGKFLFREWETARVLVCYGTNLKDYILLEWVVRLPYARDTMNNMVSLGKFLMNETFSLQEQWPDCEMPLLTIATAEIEQIKQEEAWMQFQGTYHMAVVYENQNCIGEKLFLQEEACPFQVKMDGMLKESALEFLELCYEELTTKVTEGRQLQLYGVWEVLIKDTSEQKSMQQVTEEMQQQRKRNEIVAEQLRQIFSEWTEYFQQMQAKEALLKEKDSVLRGENRISKKASLSKYMRDLNCFVQTPVVTHHFSIEKESKRRKSKMET